MGQVATSWRVWAVLVCLQVGIACADMADTWKDIQEFAKSQDIDVDGSDGDKVEARGKKKKLKYLLAFLIGVVVIKGMLIPLALKAVSFVAGKAFLLSSLSLILSAILGFKQLASHGWDRMGQMMMMRDRGEVTESYHPMPTEAMYHKISTDQYWSRDFKSK